MEIRELILSYIKEGVLLTDSKGCITYINQKSEEILGLRHDLHYSHEGGFLSDGDWVLIGDSALGVDDGGLTSRDLEILGFDGVFRKNDSLLLWAQYKRNTCVYVTALNNQKDKVLELNCPKFPLENHCSLDFQKRKITIQTGDYTFEKHYKMAYGYLLIFSATGQLKFYQEDGYTIRQESIKQIINGGRFLPKQKVQVMSLIGQNINTCFVDYHKLNQGEASLINGIPVTIREEKIKFEEESYQLYLLEDVTELKRSQALRDAALQSLERLNQRMTKQTINFTEFLGISDSIKETMIHAQKAALVDSQILITGESGTGKTLIAREIHKASSRSEKPFVAVNCSSIPDSLFESEMYGYVRGAFTGANTAGKKGYFEAANGGTLFLDEISELSLPNQAKLLHAIQEQRITRLGSVTSYQLDIRIIAATHKNLMEEIHVKRFREDLYYRINVISLVIPPLRYRREDIAYLAHKKCKSLASKFSPVSDTLLERFIESLKELPLMGNVRELENRIENFLAIGETVQIPEHDQTTVEHQRTLGSYAHEMETFEANLIHQALAAHNFKVRATYQSLEMKKSTFYDRLKRLNLDIPNK